MVSFFLSLLGSFILFAIECTCSVYRRTPMVFCIKELGSKWGRKYQLCHISPGWEMFPKILLFPRHSVAIKQAIQRGSFPLTVHSDWLIRYSMGRGALCHLPAGRGRRGLRCLPSPVWPQISSENAMWMPPPDKLSNIDEVLDKVLPKSGSLNNVLRIKSDKYGRR